MSSSGIHYAREVDPRAVEALNRLGRSRRPLPNLELDPNLPEETQRKVLADSARRGRNMLRNRVLVCGRSVAGKVVWDVLKIEGRKVSLYAKGCVFQGEAYELARACLSGRIASSIGGVRSLLVASTGQPDTTLTSAAAKPDFVLPSGDAEFWR
ncbi:MAG: hypothetical protein GY871_04595 [Actinomycetales bacterium]|nr:hypothetical protein [Actinomycetales bacterium]